MQKLFREKKKKKKERKRPINVALQEQHAHSWEMCGGGFTQQPQDPEMLTPSTQGSAVSACSKETREGN